MMQTCSASCSNKQKASAIQPKASDHCSGTQCCRQLIKGIKICHQYPTRVARVMMHSRDSGRDNRVSFETAEPVDSCIHQAESPSSNTGHHHRAQTWISDPSLPWHKATPMTSLNRFRARSSLHFIDVLLKLQMHILSSNSRTAAKEVRLFLNYVFLLKS